MLRSSTTRLLSAATAAVAITGAVQSARAELFINEIFWDNPSTDVREYVELRGTASTSLNNHYLVFLENEDNASHTGTTGQIEAMFNLNNKSIGTNGFALLHMKSNGYPGAATGTNVYTNTSSNSGFGRATGTGNIGFSDVGSDGDLENSGFTAMLINTANGGTGNAPTLNQDLDGGNNGLDALPQFWSIVDSIGIHAESDETANGRLYGTVNFGPGASTAVEPNAYYGNTTAAESENVELEWVGRKGDSTGKAGTDADDWIVANLTDNVASGYSSSTHNYGVSGDHSGSPPAFYEAFQGDAASLTATPDLHWSYGFDVTNTFGNTNNTPEPGSLSLLACGAMALLRRSRKL